MVSDDIKTIYKFLLKMDYAVSLIGKYKGGLTIRLDKKIEPQELWRTNGKYYGPVFACLGKRE